MSRLPTRLLRRLDGPLTRELRLAPGGEGLGHVPARLVPDATATSVCGYCSTGCGLKVHLRNGEAVNLSPDRDYPVNRGSACPKGWEALAVLRSPDRAVTPLLRNAAGRLAPVDWDVAAATFAGRLKDIQRRRGPDSVAWLGTGQIPTEELALLGSLAKFGMGIVHGDGNTRQCMATAVVAYKQAFGFDAPPYTYGDFEASDVIVLVGSNLCIAHPILWERVLRNPRRPDIVVLDPRKTETAMAATLHVQLRPKSDLVLLYGLARMLIADGRIDRGFIATSTSGFEEFARHVDRFTPVVVAEASGIDPAVLRRLADLVGGGRRVSFWWTMGINQSYEGVRAALAIINLALMTGNIGKPGTGANSVTGQCNAMGSRLFSNTTNLLGGRDFLNPSDRRDVAGILGIDAGRVPDRNSWAYHEIVDNIAAGRVKALWVVATNSAHSWIGQRDLHRILGKLEFLVVQDMYHTTETARRADLVLPAAGWGEKEGTFINSERRIGVIHKVCRAPGEAIADFGILKRLAHHWGCADLFERWDSPRAAFDLLKELSRGRPCDFSGVRDWDMLEASGGIQWPYPAEAATRDATEGTGPATERRLFEHGRFYYPDGRARFLFEAPRAMPEPPNPAYPLLLMTGRGTASQWHTQTRTGKSPVLRKLYPAKPYVEINPDDAERLRVVPDEWVVVESQRGSMFATAFVTPTVRPGQVFVPMHYEQTNRLTDPSFDPYSKQPSYKACAVRVRKAERWEERS
jgi:assimilatory nitrate reductase catalytic subunit